MSFLDQPAITIAQADARYAPLSQGRPRGDFVALGDSLTNNTGLYTENPQFYQDSLPSHMAAQSNGVLRLLHNAGVSGNSTAQMLARFNTDVTPYNPGTVTLLGGTNDLSSIPLSTTQVNIKAIVAKIRSIYAVPVIFTVPPYAYQGAGPQKNAIILNAWIRRYCQLNGILCLDIYKHMVDPSTGNFLSMYSNGDSVHYNSAAQVYLGNIFAPILSQKIAGTSSALLSYDNNDAYNLLSGPLFLTTPVSGIAGWWSNYGNANAQGNTATITIDSQVAGAMQTLTSVSSTSNAVIGQPIPSSKFTVGNRLAISGILTTTGTFGYVQIKIVFNGTSIGATWRTTCVVTRENFYMESVIPVGTTSMDIIMSLAIGTGSASFGQLTMYNLTSLGAN
jgi:lysophospholipase L1-like esterase